MSDFLKAIKQTCELQDKANQVMAGGDWTNLNIDWVSCACAELGESYTWSGYKHWKRQEVNLHQLGIEVIDTYHFMLSMAIEKGVCAESIFKAAFNEVSVKSRETMRALCAENLTKGESGVAVLKTRIKSSIKASLAWALSCDNNPKLLENTAQELMLLASVVGFSDEQFLSNYLVKNCINIYRQKLGDREGKYPRMWIFRGETIEDNQVAEILTKENPALAMDVVALEAALNDALRQFHPQSAAA